MLPITNLPLKNEITFCNLKCGGSGEFISLRAETVLYYGGDNVHAVTFAHLYH